MTNKIIRITVGLTWFIAGVAVLLQGEVSWWKGALFLLIGTVFIFFAFRFKEEE
jgi:Ca2+/Na+ antiporter